MTGGLGICPVTHLRLIVPPDRSNRVLDTLVADPRATGIVRPPGARAGETRARALRLDRASPVRSARAPLS
ncbi:hypothetical protein GCM10009743_18750 [Kribbella swartbergensis]